jgi:1,4-dihydroxy-2-naphthoate octaprenyltransferase
MATYDSPTQEPAVQLPVVLERMARPRRRTLAGLLWRSLRVDMALALAMPALVGAFFGAWINGGMAWLPFAFTAVAVLSLTVAYQAYTALGDVRQSITPGARTTADLPDTAFSAITAGALPLPLVMSLAHLLLVLGVVCGLWLALLAGWPVLFFGALSLLLVGAALVSPLRYAYRGWGVGELGVSIGLGLLPLVNAFYIQAQSLSWLPVMAGLPIVLLSLWILLAQNLGSRRRDWLMDKRTLPVIVGEARALDLGVVVTLLAYTSILLMTVVARLPLWLLGGLATLPLAQGAFADIRRNNVTPEDGYRLRDAAVKATIWTGILTCAALLLSGAG